MDLNLEQLVNQSLKLYLKFGIRSVSMDDIARKLTISKKTVYQLVKDKDDLVTRCIELISTQMDMSQLAKNTNMNMIEKHIHIYKHISRIIMEINPSFEYDLKKYYPMQFKLFINNRRDHIFNEMQADLVQGIEEGYFRKDIDIKKVSILNILRIESLKTTDILEKYNMRLIDLIDELFVYHLHAIASPMGLIEFEKLQKPFKN